MAQKTTEKKATYPCIMMPLKTLEELVLTLALGNTYNTKNLLIGTSRIEIEDVPWQDIQHMYILGHEYDPCNISLLKMKFSPGAYISQCGTWLMLVFPDEKNIKKYIDICGAKLKTLYILNTNLKDVSLRNNVGIERLVMHNNNELSDIFSLDSLTQLTYMRCTSCPSIKYLPGLRKLKKLNYLNLVKCSGIVSLSGLERLNQITYLNLSECKSLPSFPKFDNHPQLVSLYLNGCHQIKQVDLSGCEKLVVLKGLDTLSKLEYVNFSYCSELHDISLKGCPNITTIFGLNTLNQLNSLNLSNSKNLMILPGLQNLTGLTELNLSGCKSLTSLPGLENLTELIELNLYGCSSLSTLPGLENLTVLTHLDLSGCKNLTSLPDLKNLTKLMHLSLSGCSGLEVLPDGIRYLDSLRHLDLSEMHLKDLPVWMPEISEEFTVDYALFDGETKAVTSLKNTTIEGVDMSIFEQPYEVVVEWFKNRQAGTSCPLNEIKVVFLGDGEAGKSHTIARLMNGGGAPVDYMDKSTPGIVIKHQEYALDGRKIRVHYWDFGGQEIMHSMHRIFLTNRTMYVVLLNARDDTQGDRAHYWLQNIQSFAPDAPVLLVLNKIDQNPKASVDERTLRSKYIGLTEVVQLSALEFNQERFNREFTDVLLREIRKCDCLDAQWPQAWIAVKNRLENMHTHYILGTEYQRICQLFGVENVQTELLHWFNDLGVSFCFCDKEDYILKNHVILRPDWITNGLYIILFNECTGAHNGVIPHKSIYELLERASVDKTIRCTLPDATYNQPGDIEYVLGVMRKFQLSLDAGNKHEFIPMLCQQDSTLDIHYYEQDTGILEFRMKFEHLPDNLLHRMMVERHTELDMSNVWRKGARFQLLGTGLSAVVVIDGNVLKFFIRHTDSMHRSNTYLTMLKANVDRIVRNMGLKAPECKLVYKLDEKQDEFDYEELKMLLEIGQTHALSKSHKRMISIEDILNQAAPEGMEDEKMLLEAIRKSCLNIQGDMRYRGSDEDDRNTRIRDDLRYIGYVVHDQTRYGITESGKRAGELDLEIRKENNEPWTIVEGLRINSGAKASWNKHLDKLVGLYNPHGLRSLFLVAFADCNQDSFARIWKGYKDEHIQGHNAGKFTYVEGSFQEITESTVQLLKIAKCQYECDGNRYTVYHIFLQMEPQ